MAMRTAVVAVLAIASVLDAQELPLRAWSVGDGLSHARVNQIRRDSNGFVWFATWDGASRFDGRRFEVFGSREGLPNPLVWCTAEGPDHTIWLGTHGGGLVRVARTGHGLVVDPEGPRNPARRVFQIEVDPAGGLWLFTERGVFRSTDARADRVGFEHVDELGATWSGRAWVHPTEGLVLVTGTELVITRADGLSRLALPEEGLNDLRALATRRAGGLWVAHLRSLHVLEWDASGATARRSRVPLDLGANTSLYDVREDDAGRLWVATSSGLHEVGDGRVRSLDTSHGLPDDWIHALALDPEGGLWIGTHQSGAAFLADSGVEHYTRRTGLGDGHAVKLVSVDSEPRIVTTEVAGVFEFGPGFARRVPGTEGPPFDRIQHNLVRDGEGRWWIATTSGLFVRRGPFLDLDAAERPDGDPLAADARSVFCTPITRTLLVGTQDGRVGIRERGAGHFTACADVATGTPLRTVAEAGGGVLFLGSGSDLWRRKGGRTEKIEPAAELDGSFEPRALLVDSRGTLWMGRRFGGVAFATDPAADPPRFQRLTTRDGLASDAVFALAEDRRGNVYFGTGRGVQRLDRPGGALEVVGAADSLANEWITDLVFDAGGDLWVAHAHGVSRIHPDLPQAWRAPPRVRFTRLVVAGTEVQLPAEGTCEPPAIEVAARDSALAFEYVAVDPVRGLRLGYQTQLVGVEREWSAPTRELLVRYAGLAPGEYRFAVRCVDPNGVAPGEESVLAITVVPPLWARPWFVAALCAGAGVLGYGVHRVRVRRALALERIRTQIAADLHDDIGAGLAQIAIASEHARRVGGEEARGIMGEVAGLSRCLRESMSELVWAVDPRRDTLGDLVRRMRQLAIDLVENEDTRLELRVDQALEDSRASLPPDVKRNLFLFFKEALANVVRHAGARRVEIEVSARERRLWLRVRDDGAGFDAGTVRRGHGLANLERRARDLGGELAIESRAGEGTTIVLSAPLTGGRA